MILDAAIASGEMDTGYWMLEGKCHHFVVYGTSSTIFYNHSNPWGFKIQFLHNYFLPFTVHRLLFTFCLFTFAFLLLIDFCFIVNN
jgi:hypothetical protein